MVSAIPSKVFDRHRHLFRHNFYSTVRCLTFACSPYSDCFLNFVMDTGSSGSLDNNLRIVVCNGNKHLPDCPCKTYGNGISKKSCPILMSIPACIRPISSPIAPENREIDLVSILSPFAVNVYFAGMRFYYLHHSASSEMVILQSGLVSALHSTPM